VRAILLLVLTSIAWSAPVGAQIVRGVISDEGSSAPLAGAMVVLLDSDSVVVDRVLSHDDGTFLTKTPHPGFFFIRVDRIGYGSLTTDPFEVPVEGTYREIRVPIRPIRLRGLDVAGARRCEVRPEEGAVTARVWTEAEKALQAAAWTQETGVYRYTLLHYSRQLNRNAEKMIDESRRFRRGSTNAPFVSVPVEELTTRGFVQQHPDSGTVYHAPDAEAFLSDAFLDTHCLGVVRGDEGMIGLRFEPVEGRTLSDIEGTLWLDAESAQLERIEFRYVNLRATREVGEPGGQVEFTRLPNGTWIVREWWIRMPILVLDERNRIRRTGYRDEGGVAWRVSNTDGDIVLEASTATVTGIVQDSIRSVGVPDAAVLVHDSRERLPVQADGSFLLPGLPGGLHQISVQHRGIDTLGIVGPARTVQTELGEMVHMTLRLPRLGEALVDACGGIPRPRGTAPVFGRVIDSEGAAVRDGEVEIRWVAPLGTAPNRLAMPMSPAGLPLRLWDFREDVYTIGETTTDARGIFVLCDVPFGSPVEAIVRHRTLGTTSTELHVAAGTDVAIAILQLDEGR